METEMKNLDIDKLPLPKLVEALRQAAKRLPVRGDPGSRLYRPGPG